MSLAEELSPFPAPTTDDGSPDASRRFRVDLALRWARFDDFASVSSTRGLSSRHPRGATVGARARSGRATRRAARAAGGGGD